MKKKKSLIGFFYIFCLRFIFCFPIFAMYDHFHYFLSTRRTMIRHHWWSFHGSRKFRWNFSSRCSILFFSAFGQVLATLGQFLGQFLHSFLNCKCSLKIVYTEDFRKFSWLEIIRTVNKRSEIKRDLRGSMLSSAQAVDLEIFMGSLKRLIHLKRAVIFSVLFS